MAIFIAVTMTNKNKVNSSIPKVFCFLFLAVFLLFPITINEANNTSVQQTNEKTTDNTILSKVSSLTSSDPITISSDADFATQASTYSWPGDGSASNPYIIQNLQIINNTNSADGISISGVTKYFIIRYNFIEMTGTSSSGISIDHSSNVGTIYNNTLYNNSQYGVYLYYSHNTTVSNNVFSYNKQAGLHAFFTNQTNILNNEFYDNAYNSNSNAIYLRASHYNILKNNTISRNWYGIFHSTGSTHNTYVNNTFKDNINNILAQSSSSYPFDYNNLSYNSFDNSTTSNIYFSGTVNHNIIAHNNFTNNNDGIRFASSVAKPVNNSVYDNLFINNSYGIWSDISNSNIYNNTFINNQYGIEAISSQNGSIWDNVFKENYYAIDISSSYNATYTNNTLISNTYAFEITSGNNNTITYNYIYNNTYGFDLFNAYNNTMFNNNILNNNYGMKLFSTYNNTFYGNNFLHNTIQLSGGDASNKADNGSMGNFWLNYMSTAVDSNSDGIGDVPYTIGSITDNFPLMIWYNTSLPLEIVKANNDVTYNEGDPAFNITWRAIDESPANFIVYQNGSVIKTNTWSSFETVYVTLSGLMLGSYNYTIMYTDTNGNSKSDMVIVTVYDVTPPTIVGPTSYTYNETTTGHSLAWNVTDNHPDQYYILKDGVNVQNGTWVANANITISIDGLLKNTYTYQLFVNDTSNNIQSFTTTVIVYDGTPPTVTGPGNTTVESGSTNQTVNWNATDNYPAYYNLYRDGVLIATNPWSSNINISELIDTSTLGQYNYSIIVFDQSGNNMTDTLFITVVDTTSPVILTNPTTNISFYSGILGNDLSWTIYDLYPANYSILLNSSMYQNGTWTNNVSTNIDSLAIGFYNLTIVFSDTSGNSVHQTYWVTVMRDDIPPVIVKQPVNTSYQDITTNNVISWTAIDTIKAGNYSLFIDSVLITTADWTNNTAVPVNIDNLPVGLHNVTIVFRDAENNSIADTIWVTVFADTKSPVLVSQPSNVTYLLGSTGYNVSWTAIDDLGPNDFTLFINETSALSSLWFNNTAITVSIDALPIGLYNFTIVFNDTTGNSVSNTIWITVFTDTTSPILLQQSSNVSYLLGSTGNSLTWTAIDDYNPGNYTLYLNGTEVTTANWSNNTPVTFGIDGLPAGVYNFTIVFRDAFGNNVSNAVWVTVYVNTSLPWFQLQPSNMTYFLGTTGNTVSWTVIDKISSANYTLFLNGINMGTGYWINNTALPITIDGLTVGVYNLTIVFNDTLGNSIHDTIWITVYTDITNPIILQQPTNVTYFQGETGNNVSWTASDDYGPGNYSLFTDGVLVETKNWLNNTAVTISIDGLSQGTYNLTIVFEDAYGNNVSNTIWITVVADTTSPIILQQPSNVTYQLGATGNTLSWTVIDNRGPANYSLYIDNVFATANSWQNNTKITLNIDGLAVGVHTLTIFFNDTSGNVISDVVYVSVWKDSSPPIILQHPGTIAYTVGQTSNIAKWIVIDDHGAGNYTLLRNGTILKTGPWLNDTELSISVDGFAIGSYNLTIVFNDQSSNSVTFTFWVKVNATPINTSQTSTTTNQTTTTSQPLKTTPNDSSSVSITTNSSRTITHTTSLNTLIILGSLMVLMIRRRRK